MPEMSCNVSSGMLNPTTAITIDSTTVWLFVTMMFAVMCNRVCCNNTTHHGPLGCSRHHMCFCVRRCCDVVHQETVNVVIY